MKKAIAAVAVVAMLACTLGLAACSGGMTSKEVLEWYYDNWAEQTLTCVVEEVGEEEGIWLDDSGEEIDASFVYFAVELPEPIEREEDDVFTGMSACYYDVDALEALGAADLESDDEFSYLWTYNDDTAFSYADGTEATVEDVSEGDTVALTFDEDCVIVEVVIEQ